MKELKMKLKPAMAEAMVSLLDSIITNYIQDEDFYEELLLIVLADISKKLKLKLLNIPETVSIKLTKSEAMAFIILHGHYNLDISPYIKNKVMQISNEALQLFAH
jgi:hypothetical protein